MKIKFVKILTVFAFAFLAAALFGAHAALAADFSFKEEQPLVADAPYQVSVYLDSDAPVNAVAGEISYPIDLLQFERIDDGGSIVNFWVDEPAMRDGQIEFSGITPGGFSGSGGYLFKMIFSAKSQGAGELAFMSARTLAADGKGTALPVQTPTLAIVTPQPTGATVVPVTDTTPPEPFTPQIGSSPQIFNGQKFLVFSAADKGMGIDHYEVQETQASAPGSVWNIATSPYRLDDQALQSYIFVRAVDRAGNVRVAELAPTHPLLWYKLLFVWYVPAVAVGLVLLILIAALFIRRRK